MPTSLRHWAVLALAVTAFQLVLATTRHGHGLRLKSISYNPDSPDMYNGRLHFIRSLGFVPKVVVDVGANRGAWTLGTRNVFPEAQYFCIEANQEHEGWLQSIPDVKYAITLVGDVQKEVDYFRSERGFDTGNSIFHEQTNYFEKGNYATDKMLMHRLDDLLDSHKIHHVDFLKMDIQGAELLALKGAPRTVSQADFILLEVSVLQYNKGAPLFADIIEYMRTIKFKVFDIVEQHFFQGYLNQVDVIFIREDSPYNMKLVDRA